ncbi:hypothetical protein F511_34031 [Dorcoceras hygrometricum]|uniref:Uncharacterized protein n=1 Tax=Dorcoceras hygrometricum TaxID=472368 RepID=A0A2Z7BSW7_9LAMI|nr:hypothetical protein F511_34031 [Dorcoceras hygrometricum]
MGCPGQARTKLRSKIQPSQQSAGDRRRTPAAAIMHAAQNSAHPAATIGQHVCAVRKMQQSTAQQFARAVASDRPSMRGTSKQRPAISREVGGQLSAVAQRFVRPPCGQRPAFDRQLVRNVLHKTAGHRAATRRDIARPRGHNFARVWPPCTAAAGGQF